MTWLLVVAAGLVAETVVIVALGRHVTARYQAEVRDHADPGPIARPGPRG